MIVKENTISCLKYHMHFCSYAASFLVGVFIIVSFSERKIVN